ncbi:hypothetical protein J4423_00795 [Candidatus Pacearchaeota archaeon]|nr:hypothetical protein [Candidatus Pacearchaeota archaeon]
MTNITLSIDDSVYSRMRHYSEIKWSEFVRKVIEKRLVELDSINKNVDAEGIFTMLASEDTLKKDWLNEADEAWNEL